MQRTGRAESDSIVVVIRACRCRRWRPTGRSDWHDVHRAQKRAAVLPLAFARATFHLRWQVNYRFAGSANGGGDWSYRLDRLNLAYAPASLDIFTGQPSRYVDERAQLR
jgi:hypothetical protein